MVRNKKSSRAVALTSSMLPASGAGRVSSQTSTRHYLSDATEYTSEQVLSATQSLFPVGSQFVAGTQTFSANQLSSNAQGFIQSYDKYKITNVEIFANLASKSKSGSVDKNIPVDIWFYEDSDCDSVTATSWLRTRDRRNLGNVTLNAFKPKARLLSFEPTPSFNATSVQSQSPTNIVLNKGKWLDALNLSQQMAGFRFFAACPQVDASGQSYDFSIYLTTRYTVALQQPI
jgi:hypothetical protein